MRTTGAISSRLRAIKVPLCGLWHYGSPSFAYPIPLVLIPAASSFRSVLLGRETLAPFLLFYPVIAITALLGGAGPGLLAIVLGGLYAAIFLPTPPAPANWIVLAVLGPVVAFALPRLRQIRNQHRAAARELVRFKFISDHANDWILLLDETGQIRYANRRACADLGCTELELVGSYIESFVPDPQRQSVAALLENAKAGSANPIEVTFERRQKSPVLVELGYTKVRTGEDCTIYAVARDIQERKQITTRLQEVRHWESMGVLAGGLAHDFNNLLTSIMGYACLAEESLPPEHSAHLHLDSIVAAGERSAELVRMMLAAAGYRPGQNEPLQIDQLLNWMLANGPLPPNIRISREVRASSAFQGDCRSVETLLWALISNAVESYGEKEEGVVRVTILSGEAPPTRTDGFEAAFHEGNAGTGDCLCIVVEDFGCGIRPDVLERVFDPFFTTKFTGRGLGLPAVRGIVRAYSGELVLQTTPGRGTRVEVWLPHTVAPQPSGIRLASRPHE